MNKRALEIFLFLSFWVASIYSPLSLGEDEIGVGSTIETVGTMRCYRGVVTALLEGGMLEIMPFPRQGAPPLMKVHRGNCKLSGLIEPSLKIDEIRMNTITAASQEIQKRFSTAGGSTFVVSSGSYDLSPKPTPAKGVL